jgi:hypothetical protein
MRNQSRIRECAEGSALARKGGLVHLRSQKSFAILCGDAHRRVTARKVLNSRALQFQFRGSIVCTTFHAFEDENRDGQEEHNRGGDHGNYGDG